MSVRVYFGFSPGLKEPVAVPAGTIARWQAHAAEVESVLGLKPGGHPGWGTKRPPPGMSDDDFCILVSSHNQTVRRFYERLELWAEKPPESDTELLTPEIAQTFWHVLGTYDVDPSHWSKQHFVDTMDDMYEVLRGHEAGGLSLPCKKALTPEQAGAVIYLFEHFLGKDFDLRLEVPKGYDSLLSSDDYRWCENCGAVAHADIDANGKNFCRKRGCPLKSELKAAGWF